MTRLRDANPERQSVTNRHELKASIVATPTPWGYARGSERVRSLRNWTNPLGALVPAGRWLLASGATAVAVIGVALAFALSGPALNTAQAFPVLASQTIITPAELGQSLRIYGAGPDNAGLQIDKGHPVSTPWGTGYVLANPDKSLLCVVAPSSDSQAWGASCAQAKLAAARGTGRLEFAYSPASHSERLLDLLPQGATATVQAADGLPERVMLNDGVLALNVTQPLRLAITVKSHTFVSNVAPQDAKSAPGAATAGSGVPTAAGSSTASAQTAP